MSRSVITVTPEAQVRETAKLMLMYKIAGLPVVSGGSLVEFSPLATGFPEPTLASSAFFIRGRNRRRRSGATGGLL